jgi:hypothetical protein
MLKAGLYVAWGAGVLTSFSTLYDLAVTSGGWNRGLGILLPLSLDVYWLIALAVAMDGSRNGKARRKAAIHAAVALAASITGNLLYHEIHAGDMRLSRASVAILVAVIGSEPVLAGAALAHLSILARPEPRNENENGAPAGTEQPDAQNGNGTAARPRQNGGTERVAGTGAGAERAQVRNGTSRRNGRNVEGALGTGRRNGAKSEPEQAPQNEGGERHAASSPIRDMTKLYERAYQLLSDYRTAHNGTDMTRDVLRGHMGLNAKTTSDLRNTILSQMNEKAASGTETAV